MRRIGGFKALAITSVARFSLAQRKMSHKKKKSTAEKLMTQQCTHLDQITITQTDTRVCEDCIKIGDHWVHLRLCLACGHVGCCDSSRNKHATKHFQQVGHPLIRSIEPGETWIWCYVDQLVPGELEA
jgi:uncharacterized UBP type Zn finger protein